MGEASGRKATPRAEVVERAASLVEAMELGPILLGGFLFLHIHCQVLQKNPVATARREVEKSSRLQGGSALCSADALLCRIPCR